MTAETHKQSATPGATRPRRLRRWAGRLLAALLVATVLACVAYTAALPLIVRRVVTDILVGLGLPDARFTVQRATFWRTTLTDLTAANGDVRIDSFDVTYRPLGVVRGRVERLAVIGAQLRASVRGGKLVAPQLASATTRPTMANPPTATTASLLPFRHVELATSFAQIDWEGQRIVIPLSGGIDVDDAGKAAGHATIAVQVPMGALSVPAGNAKIRARSGVLSLDATLDATAVVTADGYHWTASVQTGNKDDVILDSTGAAAELGRVALKADASGIANPGAGTATFGRATFALDWTALPDTVLSATGWIEPGPSGVNGHVTTRLPPRDFDDAGLLAKRFTSLRGWDITGKLGVDADVSIDNGQPHGRATITIDKANATSKTAGVDVNGLNGSVAVDIDSSGPSMPTAQRIAAQAVTVGSVAMTDASLAVRMQGRDALLIDQLSANWLGGRVSTANVRINPADPKFDAVLVADRVQLKDVLALAAEGRARGEGLMSGKVAIRVNGSQVSFGQGSLQSASASGEIQVADTQWLGAALDASDPRFSAAGQLAQVKQRILEALSNFAYDRLTFNFADAPASHGLLSVSTHGKGQTGPAPQELDMTVNFSGVNDLLQNGMKWKRQYDQLTNPATKPTGTVKR